MRVSLRKDGDSRMELKSCSILKEETGGMAGKVQKPENVEKFRNSWDFGNFEISKFGERIKKGEVLKSSRRQQ